MIKGFKMHLYEGMEAEYEKRHNELWPEMKDMIRQMRIGRKNLLPIWQQLYVKLYLMFNR